jgi:hypothetical protein
MSTPCIVNGTRSIFKYAYCNRGVQQKKVRGALKSTKAITLAFLFSVVTLLLSTVNAWAQNNNAPTALKETPAKEGTYQFIFRSPENERNITLTQAQLIAIENLRKENEAVYAASISDDYIKIKILPQSMINSGANNRLPKSIFKSEMEYEELHNIRYVEIP